MGSRGRAFCAVAGLALVAGPAAALAFPEAASAHALVGRQDLPLPAWLFAWGASLVLIVSFALLSIAWKQPRLQQQEWRPVAAGLSRVLVNPVTEGLAAVVGVLLLGVALYTGLKGTQSPAQNFSITFIFVTFWLGFVLFSVLFGDVFRAFNPWRAIGRGFAAVFRGVAGRAAPPALTYPEWLGHWPAVAGIVGFVWLELVYGSAGITIGLQPETVAAAALVYTAITFVAMALFGVEKWIERGEAFSVYFRMFSTLSPIQVREGRIGLRKPLAGSTSWGEVPGSLVLVLVAIGLTTYDGASEGALATPVTETFDMFRDLGLGVTAAFRLNGSLWMLIVIAAVILLYTMGIRGMHTVKGSPSTRQLARSFAHTMIPIALAYLVAHYFSLFVFQEQAQFTYLLSDPLGEGSDLFGTASGGVDYTLISANAVWYVQVATLVAGHVAALTLAHDRALTIYGNARQAAQSQYWMLAVMVGFTCLGLYLLSQANA